MARVPQPCPACGSTELAIRDTEAVQSKNAWVECMNVNCRMRGPKGRDFRSHSLALEQGVELWNRLRFEPAA